MPIIKPPMKPPMKKIDGKEIKTPLPLPSISLTPRSAEEMSLEASKLVDTALRSVRLVLEDEDYKHLWPACATFIRDTAHGKYSGRDQSKGDELISKLYDRLFGKEPEVIEGQVVDDGH